MATNEVFIETEIKNHAHSLLATHVILEYGNQIDEWKKYINRVLDAEKLAHENIEDVLKKVILDKQEKEQKIAMFGTIALSLLGGMALSWLSGTIQYKLYPKFDSSTIWKHKRVLTYAGQNMKNLQKTEQLIFMEEADFSKVAAKFFGDTVTNPTRQGIDRIFIPNIIRKKTTTIDEISHISINGNTSSDELYLSLKTRLENALLSEKQATINQIADVALTIKNSSRSSNDMDFGKNVLKELYERQSNLRVSKDDGRILEEAKKIVEDRVDTVRELWAEKWLYYGNNPPETTIFDMSRKLEREMWAMWIMDQDFKVYNKNHPSSPKREGWTEKEVRGRNGISFHYFITGQLIGLNVVQALNLHSQQIQKVSRYHDGNFKSPNIIFNNKFIDVVINWAGNHPLDLLSGKHETQKRILPKVTQVHKV